VLIQEHPKIYAFENHAEEKIWIFL